MNDSQNQSTRIAILKRVQHRLLDGLPSSDRNAIRNAIGKPVTIVPDDEKSWQCEQQEIEFLDVDTIHTIWVDADDLDFVTNV